MKYPHWFCYLDTNEQFRGRALVYPVAVMLISEAQALCAAQRYAEYKGWTFRGELIQYESLDETLLETGLTKDKLTILTDDERGKCVAFTYCDEPGGRCGMDYYECGCFI